MHTHNSITSPDIRRMLAKDLLREWREYRKQWPEEGPSGHPMRMYWMGKYWGLHTAYQTVQFNRISRRRREHRS